MKLFKRILIGFLIILIVLVAAYAGVSGYFSNRFLPNTWINGNYCTGMTKEEVNDLLVSQTILPESFALTGIVDVETEEKGTFSFDTSEIALSVDYGDDILNCLKDQSSFQWIRSLKAFTEWTVKPDYHFSEESLESTLDGLELFHQTPCDFEILYNGPSMGYCVYNGLNHRLNEENAIASVKKALLSGEAALDLCESQCYEDMEPDTTQKKTQKEWEKLNRYLTSGPSYDFEEEKVTFGELIMASFLKKDSKGIPTLDEEGHYTLDESAVEKYVMELLADYDTYEKEWDFPSTRGDIIKVQGVTYGGIIDKEAELAWVSEYLERVRVGENIPSEEKVRVPVYKKRPYYRGRKSVGSTYIEVDMGQQHLYYYDDGELSLDTDIVTGNMKVRHDTPEGVNFVYGKAKNRILRGANYATFVYYWMPVKGAIGLHDATWRSEFGGEIYMTSGSHGCVNMPKDKAGELYEDVEIGTPVVMFY